MFQTIHLEDQRDQEMHHEREDRTDQGHDQGNEDEAGRDHPAMTEIEDIDLQTDVGLVLGNDGEIDHERGTDQEREDEVAQEKGNTVNAADHPGTNMIKYYSN